VEACGPYAKHSGSMAEAFRNQASKQASRFRKLAPGCNTSILAGSAFLHPRVSFRNPEARFQILKDRSEAQFLNEPTPIKVPRVERGGCASDNPNGIKV
jgi:hypothetical protein